MVEHSAPISTSGFSHPGLLSPAVVRALLLCAVVSTLLYVLIDAVAAIRYEGYSYHSQTISELSAIGAPTRGFWLPFGFVYSVLVLLGGLGIVAAGRQLRAVRLVGVIVILIGVIGLVAWPFAPMHQREVLAAGGGTFTDTIHLALGGIDTFLFVLAILIGARTGGRLFLVVSAVVLVTILAAGGLTALASPEVGRDGNTPWIGISERIAVFGSMLWISLFALLLFLGRIPEQRRG